MVFSKPQTSQRCSTYFISLHRRLLKFSPENRTRKCSGNLKSFPGPRQMEKDAREFIDLFRIIGGMAVAPNPSPPLFSPVSPDITSSYIFPPTLMSLTRASLIFINCFHRCFYLLEFFNSKWKFLIVLFSMINSFDGHFCSLYGTQ